MTGVTTIEDSPCKCSFRPAAHEKNPGLLQPGFWKSPVFQILTSDCYGQVYLVMLQFDIAAETLNPDFGTTITSRIFQMTTRTMF